MFSSASIFFVHEGHRGQKEKSKSLQAEKATSQWQSRLSFILAFLTDCIFLRSKKSLLNVDAWFNICWYFLFQDLIFTKIYRLAPSLSDSQHQIKWEILSYFLTFSEYINLYLPVIFRHQYRYWNWTLVSVVHWYLLKYWF